MLHAASMPELHSNRTLNRSQDEAYQIQNFQNGAHAKTNSRSPTHKRAKSTAKHQIQTNDLVRKSISLNDIPEVDMSNEAIFAMIVTSWGLDPSLNHLPLVQDEERITREDLSELLSAIAYDQVFS